MHVRPNPGVKKVWILQQHLKFAKIIVNVKIEPPSGFMCISGGKKKVWILQKYLKFAINVLKGATKVEISAIIVNVEI